MKRLVVKSTLIAGLLAGALLQSIAPANTQQVGPPALYCNKSFVVSAGATSITQIVAAVTGQAIHICGYDINAGAAAGTFQLTVGTGVNCNANTTGITPVYSLAINGVLSARNTTVWYSTPQGYQLCYTITGTGPVGAVVSYGQY